MPPRKAALAAIPQTLLDDLFTRGPLPEIRKRLLRYFDAGLETADLEMVVALLEHAPERQVRIVPMLGHVGRRHAERIGLHLERLLAAEERFAAEREDFLRTPRRLCHQPPKRTTRV